MLGFNLFDPGLLFLDFFFWAEFNRSPNRGLGQTEGKISEIHLLYISSKSFAWTEESSIFRCMSSCMPILAFSSILTESLPNRRQDFFFFLFSFLLSKMNYNIESNYFGYKVVHHSCPASRQD